MIVLPGDTYQPFATWSGWRVDGSGSRMGADGSTGWAEEVRNRWWPSAEDLQGLRLDSLPARRP